MILTLSANTAFADFPRLAGIVATDGFLPRQFANRGDRLVLSNGILVLALAAGILLVAFGGDVSALIPLFAVGLFLAFTLSQTGMVVHHWRLRTAGWKRRLAINAVGATATAVVTIVVVVSKFTEGAWVPTVVIPVLVLVFWSIKRHYRRVDVALACPPGTPFPEIVHTVVVLVGDRIHCRRVGVARLREVAAAPLPACVTRLVRCRGRRADARALGRVRIRHSARHRVVPVPRADAAGAAIRRRARQSGGVTTSSPSSFPSSSCITGGISCCTTRAR